MWHYPNPWEYQGGGCAVGEGVALMGRPPSVPCDDHYQHSKTGQNAYLDTTMGAHFAMPDRVDDLNALLRLPDVALSPEGNPVLSPWARWMLVAAVATAGVAAGAVLAHAVVRRRSPRADPVLERAAEEAVASLGSDASLMTLTDAAYHTARPDCPRRLDPDDPSHTECIRVWLELRGLAAAKLPPPVTPRPEPRAGLSDTGPAADMRGWLESLTPEQRADLRETIDAERYDPISNAAQEGDDKAVKKSVRALQKGIEEQASDDPIAAWRQYRRLKSSLGPKLDELLRLAQQYEAGA